MIAPEALATSAPHEPLATSVPPEPLDTSAPPEPLVSDKKRLNAQTGYRMSKVANFRDLGGLPIEGSTRRVKEKIIFRSAAPTYASEEDKEILLDKLNIMTLIDFRSTYETMHLNFGLSKYEDNFQTYSARVEDGNEIDKIDRGKEEIMMVQQGTFSGIKRIYKGVPRVGARRRSSSGVTRRRYALPLINQTFFFEGVYPLAPASTKLKVSALRFMVRSDKAAAFLLLRYLNSLGLFEMYRLTVEYTKREILTIFKIIKNPENHPVSFFCSLGKDRTGMIAALLLSCLGVPRDVIIDNYHETEEHLAPTIESIKSYAKSIGLDNEEFVMAPKHVMRKLLDYLDKQYGSPSSYLESIGLTREDQNFMRECFTYEPTVAALPTIAE